MSRLTIVWGVVADSWGLVHHPRASGDVFAREPSDAYADEHPAPMPMRWQHGEQIGQVIALRRAHGNLYAVGETEIEPGDLQETAEMHGDLKWSSGTRNGRRQALRIEELSLTPSPASVGLPAVRWHDPKVSSRHLPLFVQEDLERARSTSSSRDVLRIFDAAWNPRDLYRSAATGRILATNPKETPYSGRHWNPRELYYSGSQGRILDVS